MRYFVEILSEFQLISDCRLSSFLKIFRGCRVSRHNVIFMAYFKVLMRPKDSGVHLAKMFSKPGCIPKGLGDYYPRYFWRGMRGVEFFPVVFDLFDIIYIFWGPTLHDSSPWFCCGIIFWGNCQNPTYPLVRQKSPHKRPRTSQWRYAGQQNGCQVLLHL